MGGMKRRCRTNNTPPHLMGMYLKLRLMRGPLASLKTAWCQWLCVSPSMTSRVPSLHCDERKWRWC